MVLNLKRSLRSSDWWVGEVAFSKPSSFLWQECETKIAQEIASLSKEDVSKEEMNENEEVINILLAQVDGKHVSVCMLHTRVLHLSVTKHVFIPSNTVENIRGINGPLALSVKIQGLFEH